MLDGSQEFEALKQRARETMASLPDGAEVPPWIAGLVEHEIRAMSETQLWQLLEDCGALPKDDGSITYREWQPGDDDADVDEDDWWR